jgi:hypothetical protein
LGYAFSYAQNKVRGTILDNNNQPIPGATINVPEIHKETVSMQWKFRTY